RPMTSQRHLGCLEPSCRRRCRFPEPLEISSNPTRRLILALSIILPASSSALARPVALKGRLLPQVQSTPPLLPPRPQVFLPVHLLPSLLSSPPATSLV